MEVLHSVVQGKGAPLIILHGLFGMGDNWKSLANEFEKDFEVHIVDQRNHGRSFHSDDFSYELMAEDLAHYCNFHKLGKINIIGHSMGGKTAMVFATEYPSLVDKLIVADIAPRYYPPHHQFIIQALEEVDFEKIEKRSDIEDIYKKYIPEFGIRQFLLKNVYRKKDHGYAYRFNLSAIADQINEVGAPLSSFAVFEGDVLFLKGEHSGYISANDESLIKAHFPKAEIKTISNAGHWLHAENPQEFYRKSMEFLKK